MRDDPMDAAIVPPASLEAEQSVLGALLIAPDAFDRIVDQVTADDFSAAAHRTLFRAIAALLTAGEPADPVAVAEALLERGELEGVGGLAYVGGLAQGVTTAATVEHYAGIVRDRATRRRLLAFAMEVGDAAHARDGRSAADVLADLQSRFAGIEGATDVGGDPVAVGSLVAGVMAAIELRAERKEPITGLRSGVRALDEKILGLHGGELIVVGARPGHGKTTLAMQYAHAATQGDLAPPVRAAVFSLEMRASALVERSLIHVGQVDAWRVRSGTLQGDDWAKLAHAHGKLSDAPLMIDPHPSVKVERIAARARRIKRRHGLGLVVIDYLQLIDGGEGDNRNERVAYISRTLKLLALELDVPVLLLSQLNRGLEGRTNKRPMIGDLRDSGAIEADADVILFLYRDELYFPNNDDNKGRAEIIIGKQREGEVGTVYSDFVGHTNRFADTEWRPTFATHGVKRRATLDDE